MFNFSVSEIVMLGVIVIVFGGGFWFLFIKLPEIATDSGRKLREKLHKDKDK